MDNSKCSLLLTQLRGSFFLKLIISKSYLQYRLMVFTKLLFKIEFKIRMASHIFIPLKKSILSQQIWNSITHLTTMLSGVWNTT